MMLPIMFYVLLIASLLGAAALVTERIFVHVGRARRGVWLVALIASLALPAYSMLASQIIASSVLEAPPTDTEASAAALAEATLTAADAAEVPRLALPDWSRWPLFGDWYTAGPYDWGAFDKPLATFWIASSVTALLAYGLAWLGLYRATRRWHRARVDDSDVLITSGLGPATFGLLKPRIVVPRWLLDAPFDVRALVMRHEHEHVAGKDQLLLVAALLLAALAPWNPALWWQVRRLRLAIEIDCDARVVRGGADALAYSKVLLAVRQRRVATPLTAVALTEPVSQLERRIRLVLQAPPRMTRAIAALSALLATGLIVAACAVGPPDTESPSAPEGPGVAAGAGRQPVTGMRLGGERVVILVDVSATMLDRTLAGVERRQSMTAEQQREAPKWRQLLGIADALTAQIHSGAQFQIIAFSDAARSLVAGTDGAWLTAADRGSVEEAMRTLRTETTPQGPSNLHAAFTAAAALRPAPDNIYLVTDGLPTVGASGGEGSRDNERRVEHFELARAAAPSGVAINVILLPMEDDALTAPAYWVLALRTGGSLLAPAEDASDAAILGVPSDSEYLAFVIDTSGSMHQYAWDDLMSHMTETIDAYPSIKGIQVLNDEGKYLLAGYSSNNWIPSSPANYSEVFGALADWRAFSDSNPTEGVLAAIEALYAPDKKVAIYIYGDDLSRDTVSGALTSLTDRNRLDETGNRKVRIHAIAFPTYYEVTGTLMTAANYAALMRALSQQNGGSFIALSAMSEWAMRPAP